MAEVDRREDILVARVQEAPPPPPPSPLDLLGVVLPVAVLGMLAGVVKVMIRR